jgi:6-phosphogluconolactonase
MPTGPDIRIAGDGDQWTHEAAALIHRVSEEAISTTGRCLIALSGGSTPMTVYQTLTAPEWRQAFHWNRMHFFFGDERCVPPDHAESNYALAQRSLFRPLGIASDQVERMKGESDDLDNAAREYEDTLRRMTNCPPHALPRLDLILLGLGDDGHTASLFPGASVLDDRTRAVAVTHSPKGITTRLTLTLGVINRATVVLFLVTGPRKAPIVHAVLEPDDEADHPLPAALVKPEAGTVIWLLDRSAASQLTGYK